MTPADRARRAALQVLMPDGRAVSMASPEYAEWRRAEVAKAPPLSSEQKATLYGLLEPMRRRMCERADVKRTAAAGERVR